MADPRLIHERLAAQAREFLSEALNDNLTTKPRSALTLLRVELDGAKRLQAMSGQVTTWEEWREAMARVEAEIAVRPLEPRSRRYGATKR